MLASRWHEDTLKTLARSSKLEAVFNESFFHRNASIENLSFCRTDRSGRRSVDQSDRRI